jgi:hypothetical protein
VGFADSFFLVKMKLRSASLTAAIYLALGSATALARPPLGSSLSYYERYVAIDNVCAWPNLSLLPDGRIAALIWPFPNHGVTEGAVECWISADHGVSWRKAGIPVPNAPETNRMNVAAGVAGGKLVALVGGWSRRRPYEPGVSMGSEGAEARARVGAVTLTPLAAVSDDAVKWKHLGQPDLPLRPGGRGLVPYGRIADLSDTEIAACLYGDGVYFHVSRDGGASWARRGTIIEGNTHNETNWVKLDNGDLFAAVRTVGDLRLDGFRSTDGGRTWKNEGALTLARQHPADLLKLADGRVLLSYASRNSGLYGIWVQMGDPEARFWSAPVLLVNLEGSSEFQRTPTPSSDGGYPFTVLAADGTFVTAYYSRGVLAHQRYHMGVVRWRPTGSALSILQGPPQ